MVVALGARGVATTDNVAKRMIRPIVIRCTVGRCNRAPNEAHAHVSRANIGTTCRHPRIPVVDFVVQIQRSTDQSLSIDAASPPAGRRTCTSKERPACDAF